MLATGTDPEDRDRNGIKGNLYALDDTIDNVVDMESPGTPRLQTPRGGMVRPHIMLDPGDPDMILHSLREKRKELQSKSKRKASKSKSKSKGKPKLAERRKPSSPHSQKLPKPRTKGQWL